MERIRAMPRTPAGDARLAAMLDHAGSHFHGLSSADSDRLRAEILAAFEGRAAPGAVLAAIREELRTSVSPAVLAGAARALRGRDATDDRLRTLLTAASERIALRDEYVRIGDEERESGKAGRAITARQEIAAALAGSKAGSAHECCAGSGAPAAAGPFSLCARALQPVTVEDQDGEASPLVDLLRGRTSLVATFYTRCMNPAKCSLTVTRLAALARLLRDRPRGPELSLLALSYDGAYDRPDRLLAYGRDRGFPFGGRARMIRCRSGWEALRRQLGLRVGYGEATVNDHARELFLVRPDLEATGLDVDWLADCEALMARLGRAPDSGA